MRKKKKGLLSSGFMFGVDQALQKYVKEHGRLPWRRSQDSKVGSINLGLEVKRCDECDRGDCSQCVRINCPLWSPEEGKEDLKE